jgi:hypothetical protein
MQARFTGTVEILSSEFVERSRLQLEAGGVEVITRENPAWLEPMLDFEGKCHIGVSEIGRAITRYCNELKDKAARPSAAL